MQAAKALVSLPKCVLINNAVGNTFIRDCPFHIARDNEKRLQCRSWLFGLTVPSFWKISAVGRNLLQGRYPPSAEKI